MSSEITSLNFQPPLRSVMKFPAKLWKLVNVCTTGAIHWNLDGRSVIINKSMFEKQFLNPESKTFKTQNINSLIRQLNLYGFQKIPRHVVRLGEYAGADQTNILEYRHRYFQRGVPEHLRFVRRRIKNKNSANEDNQQSLFTRVMNSVPSQEVLKSQGYVPITTCPSQSQYLYTKNTHVFDQSKESVEISSNNLTSFLSRMYNKDDVLVLPFQNGKCTLPTLGPKRYVTVPVNIEPYSGVEFCG